LPGVDVVTIAAPPAAHAELALEAITAGRHVICEKPFALDTTEAVRLLDAARAEGVVHALGHELRWFPERVAILNALRAGAIGSPRLVSIVDFVSLLTNPEIRMPSWYFDANAGGGWFGASGSHAIDMVRLWLGEFEHVSAATTVVRPNAASDHTDSDDSFVLQFRLRSGVVGVIEQTGASWRGVGHTVLTGTTGTLAIEGGRPWLADADGRRALDETAADRSPDEPGALQRMTSAELPAYTQLCEAFARAIRGEEPQGDVPMPTFVDGVATMTVMDAARHSAASEGERVTIPA
jgi:predicted dehydrogenase